MIARHPHVFGDGAMRSAEAQTKAWEDMKARERAAKGGGILADVPMALPALMRAEKLTKRAARIGFDWPDADSVLEKLEEELGELAEARERADAADIRDEYGDILFVIANLGRKLGVDPEDALRRANAKFTRRFEGVERRLHETGGLEGRSLEEMEAFWRAEKEAERAKC
jgi:ATP diphosphatase